MDHPDTLRPQTATFFVEDCQKIEFLEGKFEGKFFFHFFLSFVLTLGVQIDKKINSQRQVGDLSSKLRNLGSSLTLRVTQIGRIIRVKK